MQENTIDKDTSVNNLRFKVVCLSYASLEMHSNVIDEL